jgi:hypothetical protein
MLIAEYYVTYKVEFTGDKVHEQGPYLNEADAMANYQDIKGFEGVTEVEIDRRIKEQ